MELNIKYFGILAEVTQCNEETFVFKKQTISELITDLCSKYPQLKGKEFQVAQNQKIVTPKSIVSEGEIALLPPFSGG